MSGQALPVGRHRLRRVARRRSKSRPLREHSNVLRMFTSCDRNGQSSRKQARFAMSTSAPNAPINVEIGVTQSSMGFSPASATTAPAISGVESGTRSTCHSQANAVGDRIASRNSPGWAIHSIVSSRRPTPEQADTGRIRTSKTRSSVPSVAATSHRTPRIHENRCSNLQAFLRSTRVRSADMSIDKS